MEWGVEGRIARGQVLGGRYTVLEKLDDQGILTIWKVEDRESASFRILTQITVPGEHQSDFLERFHDQGRRLAGVRHPSLPLVRDLFEHRGTGVVIRDYVERNTTADLVRATGPVSTPRIVKWAGHLAGALAALHDAPEPLAFGGLKPDNVMITPLGRARILDYGGIRFLPGSLRAQWVNRILGMYASPEERRGEEPDVRSDVYTLGALMTFYALGHSPGEPPPEDATPPAIEEDLRRLLLACLDADPAHRPDYRQFRTALGVGRRTPRTRPRISTVPESIDLDVEAGSTATGPIQVVNAGGGNLSGVVEAQPRWLEVKPPSFFGDWVTLRYTVDGQGFDPDGIYSGRILIACGDEEVEIPVVVRARPRRGILQRLLGR